jgi:thioredoxin reductase (NADPH)
MSEYSQKFDIIIIGAGPAGLTAGIYSAWLGLKTLILESAITGGRAAIAPRIGNFPGFEEEIAGSELVEKMTKQATRMGAKLNTNEEVIGLNVNGILKKVITRQATYETSAIIVTTGTQKRKLHVPGEEEFLGRGVSYCAVCDGPFFRKANVAVIGDGEEAATDAIYLSKIVNYVTVITQNPQSLQDILGNKLINTGDLEIIHGKVLAIEGEQVVKKIKVYESANRQNIEKIVKGVFIALGGVPMTAVVRNAGIKTDRSGCINVDRQQRTNIEGVFAAGDCTCGGMQIVTAAGEGAMAAMHAAHYARQQKSKPQLLSIS